MDITSDIHSQHISRQFNQELEELKTHLMAMGGLVEKQVQDAVAALLDADSSLAQRVVDNDRAVNDMQIKIDEECTRVLARRQPAASDLRLVLAVIRAASDLERIGDEASKIARNAIDLINADNGSRGFVEVRMISEHVRRMVRDALTSFARFDTELALQLVHEDDEVDNEYRTAMRSLMTFMMEDARSISSILNVMWILRALERIGDHANNLAEYVIYLVKGLDIRHSDPDELDEQGLSRKG
ncbi:phosphate signaling complex protein PhoU [Halomonas urumqiensis]|uniref:Phosphate-specific transport system accessory protein PhoU n=1 Tax=Halomonas urumqiensis TaxID=1684789 RepID=A0A2N7UJL3_9GAMM|nr:phosphate signaling complex protein PhoU [Halomonas urumqiensis]PMR80622.1 phosphate transport system regulatory protein PhoU [Halomonas urumqiensis]PTB02695.1 phosphate transport system regulatory protein PhoU [Halomonas urumqiensis]GHE21192.1 phosphate transport system regulatory protein PhoU [Halomonas urumqiensis]